MRAKRLAVFVALPLVATGLLAAALPVLQEEAGPQLPEELGVLEHSIGTWDCRAVFHEAGGTLIGTLTNSWACGEMWVVSEFEGRFSMRGMPEPMPFSGHQVTGWNIADQKYCATWVDSMTPFMAASEGTWHGPTRTMSWFGEAYDAETGERCRVKMTDRIVDEDTNEFIMSRIQEDGQVTKDATFHYTRKKE